MCLRVSDAGKLLARAPWLWSPLPTSDRVAYRRRRTFGAEEEEGGKPRGEEEKEEDFEVEDVEILAMAMRIPTIHELRKRAPATRI